MCTGFFFFLLTHFILRSTKSLKMSAKCVSVNDRQQGSILSFNNHDAMNLYI